MWWGEGVAREKADHGSLPPTRCECQPVACAGSGSLLRESSHDTRGPPPVSGQSRMYLPMAPCFMKQLIPFIMISDVDKICLEVAFSP